MENLARLAATTGQRRRAHHSKKYILTDIISGSSRMSSEKYKRRDGRRPFSAVSHAILLMKHRASLAEALCRSGLI